MWLFRKVFILVTPARKYSPSPSGYHFNYYVPNRTPEQTRLSVYSWNPGPRRGKAGAFESHIARKWHIITFQEAIEYLEHDFLTNRFHVTHNGGESGWVMRGVFSKAAFLRQPRNGQQAFTVMSLHINNNYAKKRDVGKKLLLTIRAIMHDEHVNLVAGDFNGAAWRQTSGNNPHPTSTLEEAFADTDFPMPPGPHHCGVPELFPVSGPTYAVSSHLQIHMIYGKYACMWH